MGDLFSPERRKAQLKTLILNGSPRKNGDTAQLIRLVTEKLAGEYKIVDAYTCGVSPCVDCRRCREQFGCAISDEMQQIYAYIQACNNILIASPIYFSELTGRLLDLGSRLQTYFCARFFRGEEAIAKSKRGAVILVGGGDGGIEKPFDTARTLLHHMRCTEIYPPVCSHNTNQIPACEDEQALSGIDGIVKFFNR